MLAMGIVRLGSPRKQNRASRKLDLDVLIFTDKHIQHKLLPQTLASLEPYRSAIEGSVITLSSSLAKREHTVRSAMVNTTAEYVLVLDAGMQLSERSVRLALGQMRSERLCHLILPKAVLEVTSLRCLLNAYRILMANYLLTAKQAIGSQNVDVYAPGTLTKRVWRGRSNIALPSQSNVYYSARTDLARHKRRYAIAYSATVERSLDARPPVVSFVYRITLLGVTLYALYLAVANLSLLPLLILLGLRAVELVVLTVDSTALQLRQRIKLAANMPTLLITSLF